MFFLWSFFIVDTNTGVKQLQVFPFSGSWRSVINGFGSGQHAFQLRDFGTKLPRATWRSLTQPWARTLVVCWAGVPVYAGIIQHRHYSRATGILTVRHSEVRSIFSRRHPFGVNEYEVGTLTVTNKSIRGAIRAIVLACAGPRSSRWVLPIVYPPDEAGTYSNTWPNFSFPLGEKMISDAQDMEGGPDVHFQPRWAADGSIEYELRLGVPRIPGATFEWLATAEQSGAIDAEVEDDASKQLTGVLTIGEGSEVDIKWGRAPELTGGSVIPYLDTSRPYKSIGDQAQLDSFARAELATFREPTTQYSMSVLASGYPGADKLQPGSRLRLGFNGDEFINDGFAQLHLLGLSGDMTQTIKLEVQGV